MPGAPTRSNTLELSALRGGLLAQAQSRALAVPRTQGGADADCETRFARGSESGDISQLDLMRDVLYALQGVEGKYLRYDTSYIHPQFTLLKQVYKFTFYKNSLGK